MQKVTAQSEFQLPLLAKICVFVIPIWVINAYALRLGVWPIGVVLSVITTVVLSWQWPRIEQGLVKLRKKAVNDYHVSPKLFASLYVISFVPFYLGLFMMAEGVVRQSWLLIALGGLVNRLAFALPYLYVIFWGTLTDKVGFWKIRIRLDVLVWVWLTASVAFFIVTKLTS